MDFTEKTLSTKQIYDGKILGLRVDTVELPGGNTATREVVEHSGGVCVAALDEKDRLLFVRQFRYPHGRVLLELPAGKINKGEDPAACGFRELMEETGFGGGEWEPFMNLCPNPGTNNNIAHTFLARGVEHAGAQHFDANEDLDVYLLTAAEVRGILERGEIMQALMAAPLWRLVATHGL